MECSWSDVVGTSGGKGGMEFGVVTEAGRSVLRLPSVLPVPPPPWNPSASGKASMSISPLELKPKKC